MAPTVKKINKNILRLNSINLAYIARDYTIIIFCFNLKFIMPNNKKPKSVMIDIN